MLEPEMTSIRAVVRGRLNCNQVLLLSEAGHVLIDSGYSACAEETLRLIALPANLGKRPLTRVINTHCHADHVGGNAALVRRYGCAVSIPAADARDVRAWNRDAFLIDYADHHIEPFEFTDALAPGDRFDAGGFAWQALAAPGHDMNALMFWCEEHGILISGDALWDNGLGAMFPLPSLDDAVVAGFATLDRIQALHPRWVIPGHGAPFTDVAGAIARARGYLDVLAADPARNARHVLKELFCFALLEKQGMYLSEVVPYVATVPCYRDLNERFIDVPMPQLADELIAELVNARMVTVDNGWIKPAIAA